jgi:hypothetical protein
MFGIISDLLQALFGGDILLDGNAARNWLDWVKIHSNNKASLLGIFGSHLHPASWSST